MADEDKKSNPEDPEAAAAEAAAAAQKEVDNALAVEAEKARKKSVKLFIIMAIANVSIITWLFYTMGYEVEEPPKDEIEYAQEEIEEEVEESDEIEALTDAIPIEPFLVNVIARHKGKARQGQKVLRVRFEVVPESESTANSLEKFMPKIRDSINALLSSQDYGDLAMSDGREAIRNLIKDQINEVIQPDRIKKVYFIEFVIN